MTSESRQPHKASAVETTQGDYYDDELEIHVDQDELMTLAAEIKTDTNQNGYHVLKIVIQSNSEHLLVAVVPESFGPQENLIVEPFAAYRRNC